MKSRIKRVWVMSIFLIFAILILLLNFVTPVLGSSEITGTSVTPRGGEPDDELLFLVTYSDPDNEPPEYVRLVVDNDKYKMRELNSEDLNYSDGKDYLYRLKLSEGTHIYYFEASTGSENVSSRASTIRIKSTDEFTHLDVAYSLLIATVIILIPVVYGIYYLRKLTKTMEQLTKGNIKEKKKR